MPTLAELSTVYTPEPANADTEQPSVNPQEQVVKGLADAYSVDLSRSGAQLSLDMPMRSDHRMSPNFSDQIVLASSFKQEDGTLSPDLDMTFAIGDVGGFYASVDRTSGGDTEQKVPDNPSLCTFPAVKPPETLNVGFDNQPEDVQQETKDEQNGWVEAGVNYVKSIAPSLSENEEALKEVRKFLAAWQSPPQSTAKSVFDQDFDFFPLLFALTEFVDNMLKSSSAKSENLHNKAEDSML